MNYFEKGSSHLRNQETLSTSSNPVLVSSNIKCRQDLPHGKLRIRQIHTCKALKVPDTQHSISVSYCYQSEFKMVIKIKRGGISWLNNIKAKGN